MMMVCVIVKHTGFAYLSISTDVVTEDKLWSEIKDNLSKDISKYQEIILSTMSLQTQLSFSKEVR